MKGYISKRIVGRKSVTPGNNHLLPLSLLFTSNFILKISHQPSIVIQQQNSLPLFRHISQTINSNSFHSKVVFVFPAYISDKIGFNLEFQIQSFEIKKKKKGVASAKEFNCVYLGSMELHLIRHLLPY